MRALLRTRWFVIGVPGLLLLLSGGLWWWWPFAPEPALLPVRRGKSATALVLSRLESQLSVDEARLPGRNPFQEPQRPQETVAAPTPTVVAPTVEMRGWARLGGTDYALVWDNSEGERYLKNGDTVGDWQVSEVGRDRFILIKAEHTVEVILNKDFSVTSVKR